MSVIWHDLECGAYSEDLPLWRSLAAEHGDPVLDVGAGTGRVTFDLARAGYRVTALDRDPELLSELARRAASGGGLGLGRNSEIVRVSSQPSSRPSWPTPASSSCPTRYPLCIVPMQTIQLLGGADGRAAFLRCALRQLRSRRGARGRDRRSARAVRGGRRFPVAAARHPRRRRGRVLEPAGGGPRRARRVRARAAPGDGRGGGRANGRTRPDPPRSPERPRARARGARRRVRPPRAGAGARRPRTTSGARW